MLLKFIKVFNTTHILFLNIYVISHNYVKDMTDVMISSRVHL